MRISHRGFAFPCEISTKPAFTRLIYPAPAQVLTLTQGATLLDIAPNHLMIKRETVYRSMFLVLFGSVDVIAARAREAMLPVSA